MTRLIVSGEAEADLRNIASYIADDNPARARSFVVELRQKFRVIVERPQSFPARNEWHPGLRSALHGKYLILFTTEPGLIRIVRVLHGSRDVGALLTPPPE